MTSIAAIWTPETDEPARRPMLHPTFVKTEVIRLLRNRKALMFAAIMPVVLCCSVLLGLGAEGATVHGHANLRAIIMSGLVLYGTAMIAMAAGASVSVETAQGWVRTLNLTPLSPLSYVATKAVAGMAAGALPVVAVTTAGLILGARAAWAPLVTALLVAWLAAALFAALGLVLGLLLPSEVVGQVMGLLMTVLGFAGGLFMPLSGLALMIGRFTPMYGVNALCRWALTGQVELVPAVTNVAVWAAIFVGAAAVLFRRRTERV